jgi:hypothetical protein
MKSLSCGDLRRAEWLRSEGGLWVAQGQNGTVLVNAAQVLPTSRVLGGDWLL